MAIENQEAWRFRCVRGVCPWSALCVLMAASSIGCMSSVDGPDQERWLAPDAQGLTKGACVGQTRSEDWHVVTADYLYVDVDTSHCGLRQPLYFTSLEGSAGHWLARGASSVHRPTSKGFRVFVTRPEIAKAAQAGSWILNWMGQESGLSSPALCTGRSDPQHWRNYEDGGVVVDIDTRHCGFDKPPVILSSLMGAEGHSATRGASSVYRVTEQGFRVYIQRPETGEDKASELGWHLAWAALLPAHEPGAYCAGRTAPEASPWQPYGRGGVFLDVETPSGCGGLTFSSLGGDVSHWYTSGASSIYRATDDAFRIYIRRGRVSPTFAAQSEWHINWLRVAPPTLEAAAASDGFASP